MANKIHDGHRERMRERIRRSGLSALQEHEMLEYILYAFIPRKDTNEIAHALIDKFGSFAGVLNADENRLAEVAGMTANAALFISALPDVFRAYIDDLDKQKPSLKGRGVARSYMGNRLYGVKEEQLHVAALDAHDNLICCRCISKGSGDAVELSVRAIVDFALNNKASGLLVAHNHPSGNVNPSQKDIEMARELYITLSSVGVELQDHFIFCGSDYYSFEEQGKLERIRNAKNCLKEGINFYE